MFETDNDYDIRARLTLRYRLFGGGDARAEQFAARARSGQARADRVREEARRDAAIAWADVNALTDQLGALRSSYVASRQSRDTIAERFSAEAASDHIDARIVDAAHLLADKTYGDEVDPSELTPRERRRLERAKLAVREYRRRMLELYAREEAEDDDGR